MLNIYINNIPLTLATKEEAKAFKMSKTKIVAQYMGKPRFLYHYIDSIEKGGKLERITLFSKDFEKLKKDFKSLYKIKEAAGGVVFNDKNEVLMMYRRGSWDMAKGHIDKGESQTEAAIREVQEETGLINVDLGEFLTTTYHTCKNKKEKRVLKVSHWYRMTSNDTQLIPQTEEDIEKLEWMTVQKAKGLKPIYKNILHLLELVNQ